MKKKELPTKLNLLSNLNDDLPPPVFDKPNYLDGPKTLLDYIDLIFEKSWRIWALVIGGVILIWLAWMR